MLARSVTLNVLGQGAALASGFVSSILLARLLGPADRGLLGVLASVTTMALVLGGLGLPFSVAYFAARPERRSGAILGDTVLVAAVLGALLVPLAWALSGPLGDAFARGHDGAIWVLAAALVPVTFLDYTTQNQVLGQRRFGLYNLVIVLNKVVGLVVVVALIGVLDLGVAGGILALAAGSATTVALSLPRILAEGPPTLDLALLRRMLGYGGRVQVGSIFQVMNYRLDVLVLQFFRPLSEVGYYVVAQVIAELVTTLSTAFATSVLPLVAGSDEHDERARTTVASLRHHGVLTIVAILLNLVFGTLIILFAYGPSYRPALVPMLIILPGMWFLGTASVVTGDLRGRGRPGTASSLAGGAVIVTVALDVLLIPRWGVNGAAVASLVTYVVLGIASLVVLSRVGRLPLRSLLPSRADAAAYVPIVRAAVARVRTRFA
jgi:O-antigen/teichoic acid export membrane protein